MTMGALLFFAIAGGAVLLGLVGYLWLASIEEKQLRDDQALRRLMEEERLSARAVFPVAPSSATPV